MGFMSLEELHEEVVACRKCPRLVAWREEVARTKRKAYMDWEYWELMEYGICETEQTDLYLKEIVEGKLGE